jgi:hypothetical protein
MHKEKSMHLLIMISSARGSIDNITATRASNTSRKGTLEYQAF